MIDRRSFLAFGVSTTAAAAQTPPPPAAQETSNPASPFTDPDFGFTALIALGGSYHRGGDPGKLLADPGAQSKPGISSPPSRRITTPAWKRGRHAEQAAAKRHGVSAREAWLWAAGYFSAALRFLDGTKDPDRMPACWQEYNACWSAAAALFDPPVERLEIPYEGEHPDRVVPAG